ncbi:hypothetical protein G3570_12055 [Balneolaceae bacterium YR4-1]|uniref:histidine kinase n=1 Tax=Halalkalibaculum roseum TaxID=2709311 RepID=A0A6M1SWP2_9BACT|nr:ATP-binding protein [Halalkalibaculum roseum]NGP77372.1 hypothetical protein [Halalkalibaculum roseum]
MDVENGKKLYEELKLENRRLREKVDEYAREVKIQLSIERVRTRTMAMHDSSELAEVASVFFEQISLRTSAPDRFFIGIIDEDSRSIDFWITDQEGHEVIKKFTAEARKSSIISDIFLNWKSNEKFWIQDLSERKLENWIQYWSDEVGIPFEKNSVKDHRFIFSVYFSEGLIGIITHEEPSIDSILLLERFSDVFQQTYTRFLDLKKAERLVLETARQASLDRIRAEIASMRNSEDLEEITPLIWDELKVLEIPFIRCGVFIIEEQNEISHTYLSTAQGEPIAALHLPLEGIPLIEEITASWQNNELYTIHWEKKDFNKWTQNLMESGFIDSKKKYEAGSAPEKLDLHFFPFKHGMLYIGNTAPLEHDSLDLGQTMADVFSVAYDRYEDFKELERAKEKIEEAFQELEVAQEQLVQQEKLASLGQLSAGIAHEIKNPLNFVINFSDLSVELLEETNQELNCISEKLAKNYSDKVNEALITLKDIGNYLNKIHEHGARADAIVKSMLQHSRGGDGNIEPTPLNPIVKEFVNLAYHGMRASKHPFNVDVKLQLDESIDKVTMVAEDFSRVILNLCNNAFDAMREKMMDENAQSIESYIPLLIVRTQNIGNEVAIYIEDNGPGIPEDTRDKIMQPFFTTKKGTNGTGLGLSITNDIIKAHGGTIKLNSQPGKTVFIIVLSK